MAKQIIANFLKQLRKTSGLSANEVVTKLQSYNIDISAKTLYGYESGLSMLNADAFVALCRIYKCDNPKDIFGTPSINSNEIDLIEKYRTLDPFGQETVNYILNREAGLDIISRGTLVIGTSDGLPTFSFRTGPS
ncbi:MAG: helix-turn-helix domain-containing protein [Lachnospiraceae bacterium]|nr:helix-turn-helix domain-containing protein [Lachnospiraceae bacterium]